MKIEYTKDGIKIGDEFISLDEITNNVNEIRQKEGGLVLLTMSWKGGRGFDGVIEQIILPLENAERVIEIMLDKTIHFGEIAGKHSDIHGPLEDEDYDITTDTKVVSEFLKDNPNGHLYDHSFIDTFSDYATCGGYDDVSEEEVEEFKSLLNWKKSVA
jgi:hypothetical protein